MIRLVRVAHAVGTATRLAGLGLLVPMVASLLLDPWDRRVLGSFELPGTFLAFGLCAALGLSLWLPLRVLSRDAAMEGLSEREGYLGVALGWLVAALVAGSPFLLLRVLGPLPSFFEAMSGLTGTGITAIAHLDGMPQSLLLWRSFLQWAGGLAVTVLSISLLARLTHGGLQWMGPARARWRLQEVAQSVGGVYVVVTLVFAIAVDLVLTFRHDMAGLPALMEALTQVFAAYGNGAFTLHPHTLFPEDSLLSALRATMMIAGALNLPVAILLARRRAVRTLGGNAEVRFFLTFVILTSAAVAFLSRHDQPLAALQASIAVATGAGLSSFPDLASPAMLLLILAAVTGGMMASPSGGLTAYRTLALIKSAGREVRRLLHPNAVIPIRIGGRILPEDSVLAIIAFFFSFITAWILGIFALSLFEPGMTLSVAASGALAALSNVAFGFGPLAAPDGYAHLHLASQATLAALMWLGRLEIFAALVVFLPSTWRN